MLNEGIATLIDATVPSGFERVSLEEIAQKLPGISETSFVRGHVRFQLSKDVPAHEQIEVLKALRSVDNLYIVIGTKDIDFASKKDIKSGLLPILEGMTDLEWQPGIEFWRQFTGYEGDCLHTVDGKQLWTCWDAVLADLDRLVGKSEQKTSGANAGASDKSGEKKSRPIKARKELFSFRATSSRSGNCHSFTSREVEAEVGGLLHVGFGWPVDLTGFDMEVFVIVRDNLVSYCLSLTAQSLHRRNAVQVLGNMSLRSTIAYNMLRLCDIQLGDVVVDPMCGSGAVLVESILSEFGSSAFHIAADLGDGVVQSKASPSIAASLSPTTRGGDCMVANCCSLPFRTASIDVIIADLPFGKRCGNKQMNKWLYPTVVKEFARVLVPSTGRACLLTADAKNMGSAIRQSIRKEEVGDAGGHSFPYYWARPYRSFTIHHGGLNPLVYLLRRTAHAFL